MTAPSLKTKRLILRQWKNEDLIPFAKMNSDPKVMEFFPSVLTKEKSDEIAKKIQKELSEKEYGFWAVEEKKTKKFIGFVGLHLPEFSSHFTPCIEIGWRLAYEFWGQGFAFEAAEAVLKYAFSTLHLSEIVAFTAKTNLRSRKLMEKLEMSHDEKDDFDHPKIPKNHPLSLHVLYRIKNYTLFKKSNAI